MKTKFYIVFVICFFLLPIQETSAQSFWKQLGKAAEQIGKELITPPTDAQKQEQTQTTTEQQQKTATVANNGNLTPEQRNQLFLDIYGKNSKLPEKSFLINPTKVVYYGVYKESALLLAIDKKDNNWAGIKPIEIGDLEFASIDSIQIQTLGGKPYLYYEYYMPGGNAGNYNISFGLYELENYTPYALEYEYYPVRSTGKIEVKFTPSSNLFDFPDLSDYLDKKAHSSSRISKEKNLVDVTIKIPKTKSVMSIDDGYDKYYKGTALTTAQKTALKLNNIQKKYLKDSPGCKFYKGKVFYQGVNGKMESVIVVIPDHATQEILISYDAKGNYKDSAEIAGIMNYAGDRWESFVQGNKIQTHFTWPVFEGEEGDGESFGYHEITSDLRFVKLNQ